MKIKKNIFLLYVLFALLLTFSCSNKKNKNSNNNFLAYYNTFYSAQKNFDDAIDILSKTNSIDDKIPSTVSTLLDKAIENAYLIEEKYYNTKYLDDAFFIIAKSTYLKGKVSGANYYFKKIINDFKDSKYYFESLVWLGFIFLDLNNSKELESIILKLDENFDAFNNNELFIYYLLKAKINELENIKDNSNFYYTEAVKYSPNIFEKNKIYKKLISIYEDEKDFYKCSEFLAKLIEEIDQSEYNFYIEKWFYSNAMVGNYDKNYNFISDKLNDNISVSDKIFYQIQLAKSLYLDNQIEKSQNIYIDLIDEYANKNAANLKPFFCDVYFDMGKMYMNNFGDFFEAKKYFDKCKDNCLSQDKKKFKNEALTISSNINNYFSLIDEFEIMQKNPAEDSVLEKNEDKNPFYIPIPKDNNVRKSDQLLYEMGILLLFKLELADSSISKFKKVYNDYDTTQYAYKSVRLLNEIDKNNNWESILNEKFSNYIDLENDELFIMSLRKEAWDQMNFDILSSINKFLLIYNNYNDHNSLYYVSYLYDNYLDDLELSFKYYKEYQRKFKEGNYINEVNSRINEITRSIENEIDYFNQTIYYLSALKFLDTKSINLDSAKYFLDLSSSINSNLNLNIKIDKLDDFIKGYEDILDSSDSGNLSEYEYIFENNVKDSIFFDTIRLEYFNIKQDLIQNNQSLERIKNLKEKLFPKDEFIDNQDSLFSYNQSVKQYFYFVEYAEIDKQELNEDDWMVAYNNDKIVGARKYKEGGNIDIPIMGFDDSSENTIIATDGYCMPGDLPTIKIHRKNGEIIGMNIELLEDGSLEFKGIGHVTVKLSN